MRFVLFVLSIAFICSLLVDAKKVKKEVIEKPAKLAKPEAAVPAAAQSLNGEPGEELAPEPAPIVRPKQMRVLTAYDKCKAECKKERDAEGLKSYVQQLRDELQAVETALAEEEAAKQAAQATP